MHSYSLTGIVIKRLNVGEADKIITIFTKEMGKVSLLAKNIRKPNSKRSGNLELFNQVKVSVIKAKTNLDILTEAQMIYYPQQWKNFLGRINIAYQLTEIIDKIIPENEPYPIIYNNLLHNLSNLSQLGNDWESVVNEWILTILIDLGYWPKNKIFTGNVYKFIEEITQRPINSPQILSKLKN